MSYLLKLPFHFALKMDGPWYPAPWEGTYVVGDSHKLHEENKILHGPNWRYYDYNFTYKYNTHGYRMNKELDAIDFDNYIAFFGCSFTVGVGLALEDTFAYRIADQLKCDYVNGALTAGSPSLVSLNITKLFKSAPKLPKAIIINWPPIHRTHYWYKNKLTRMLPNFIISPDNPLYEEYKYWRAAYETTILEDSHINNTFTHIKDNVVTLCRLASIPLFQMSTFATNTHSDIDKYHSTHSDIRRISRGNPEHTFMAYNLKLKDIPIEAINSILARDIIVSPDGRILGHPGIAHQDAIVNQFFEEYPHL